VVEGTTSTATYKPEASPVRLLKEDAMKTNVTFDSAGLKLADLRAADLRAARTELAVGAGLLAG
jgi:hypothetical protein